MLPKVVCRSFVLKKQSSSSIKHFLLGRNKQRKNTSGFFLKFSPLTGTVTGSTLTLVYPCPLQDYKNSSPSLLMITSLLLEAYSRDRLSLFTCTQPRDNLEYRLAWSEFRPAAGKELPGREDETPLRAGKGSGREVSRGKRDTRQWHSSASARSKGQEP